MSTPGNTAKDPEVKRDEPPLRMSHVFHRLVWHKVWTNERPVSIDGLSESVNNLQAACARTLSRGLALYFSRPVRLFRPAKGRACQHQRPNLVLIH
jgi:hypothetical protein